MVQARPPGPQAAQGVRRHIGDQVGAGRRTHLIVDHAQHGLAGSQAQHRPRKILALQAIDPAAAQHQMVRPRGGHRLVAGKLAAAILIERRGRTVLGIGRAFLAVEDVVARVMHQPPPAGAHFAGQQPGRLGVDLPGRFRLLLGAIHGGIGCGVDDHVGRDGAHRALQRSRVGQVAAQAPPGLAAQGHHLAQRRQGPAQGLTQLTLGAQQQQLHGAAPSQRAR
ncbi:Uncharacterised protein [Bordetella trematum]|uniref:Uncharacterized protein n=1 Tax=Bordetella trematum TaxID=123899 RepID=A0A157SE24_9BORD|nr:Uncharacterised protein [Bordetella trematum]